MHPPGEVITSEAAPSEPGGAVHAKMVIVCELIVAMFPPTVTTVPGRN